MTSLQGPRTAAPLTEPRRPGRDAYWDNVRFVAITLVVVGHAVEPLSASRTMYALYLFIYAFHMPLFALASGVFARAEPLTRRDGGKLFVTLLVPYVLFSALWALVRAASGEPLVLDLGNPYWHLWFLTALVVWRLALPVLSALRMPLLWSVLIAVGAGYAATVGWRFDASRTLGFLPFFVLGWQVRQRDGWERLRALGDRPTGRAVAAGALVLAAVAGRLGVDTAQALGLREWLQLERNYPDLGVTAWYAAGGRLLALLVAAALCAAVLVLVPRHHTRISDWGRATLYVYLLHLFPLYLLRQAGWLADELTTGPGQVLVVLAAGALAVALSTQPVVRATRWLVEPPWARRLLVRAVR